jgi:hypothetical protein
MRIKSYATDEQTSKRGRETSVLTVAVDPAIQLRCGRERYTRPQHIFHLSKYRVKRDYINLSKYVRGYDVTVNSGTQAIYNPRTAISRI